MWNAEETAEDITNVALNTLANRLLGSQENRVAMIQRVREVLNQQLDQVEQLQRPTPESDQKGWFITQCEAINLVNPSVIMQAMLKDKPGRVNLSIYCPDPFREQSWDYRCCVMAWDFDHDDLYCWFNCLGQDRLAPGDILVESEKRRWVVDRVRWEEVDKTWWVHAVKPNAIEAAFDFHSTESKM